MEHIFDIVFLQLMRLAGSLPAPPRRDGLLPPPVLSARPNGTALYSVELEPWLMRINNWCVYDADLEPFQEKSTYCGFVVNGALV